MKKSKSWLKSLLIVVMAMLMVVSLVACNKTPEEEKPIVTEQAAADFFNELWTVAKPIGTTKIEDNADLSLELGMEFTLDLVAVKQDEKTKELIETHQPIDLGLDIQAVLGRKTETSKNTAVKIRLYDPTDADHAEIITLYEFANDIDNLYIDFAGKNVKVPHDLAKLIWGEILGHNDANDDLGANIIKGLDNTKLMTINGVPTSLNMLINQFTGDFGENWSLNAIIDKLIAMFNFNVVDVINGIEKDLIKSTILSILHIQDASELLDEEGKLNVLDILTGDIAEFLFKSTNTVYQGIVTHEAVIQDSVLGLLGSFGFADITSLIGKADEGGKIALVFNEKDNVLQDFAIKLKLSGMMAATTEGTVTPELSVKINKLNIAKLDTTNGIETKVAKDQYKEEIAFNEQLVFETHGVTIDAIEGLTESAISLNGEIIVDVKGKLDIVNKTNNKTQANITVSLKNGNAQPATIAQVSYANGKIVGELAETIKIEKEDGSKQDVKGFVYDFGKDFNVASFVQNNIKEFIYKMFPSIKPVEGGNNANPSAEGDSTFDLSGLIKKALGIYRVVVPMIKVDNNIEISTANILKTVVDFKEAINPGTKQPTNKPNAPAPENPEWTVENRIVAIANALLDPPNADKDINACIQIIKDNYATVMEELNREGIKFDEIKTAVKPLTDAALRILYLCAQEVHIAGVKAPANYNGIVKPDESALTTEDKAYVNNIIAVLGAQITVKGDLQDGMHASISVKIADATMSVSHSFELIDVAANTFTDLYSHYTDDANKAQWLDLNEMFKEQA